MLTHEIGVLSDLTDRSIWTLIYLNRFHLSVEALEYRSVPLSPLFLLMVCWAREVVFGGGHRAAPYLALDGIMYLRKLRRC